MFFIPHLLWIVLKINVFFQITFSLQVLTAKNAVFIIKLYERKKKKRIVFILFGSFIWVKNLRNVKASCASIDPSIIFWQTVDCWFCPNNRWIFSCYMDGNKTKDGKGTLLKQTRNNRRVISPSLYKCRMLKDIKWHGLHSWLYNKFMIISFEQINVHDLDKDFEL